MSLSITVSRYVRLCLSVMLTADFICHLETHLEIYILISESLSLLSVYPVFVWHNNLSDTQD